MSKSLGNGIDPLEVIKDYGADALRLTLITGNAPGNDMRFYYSRMDNSRNFGNKLWNAARFVMMHIGDSEPKLDKSKLTSADKWILSKVNTLAKEVTDTLIIMNLVLLYRKFMTLFGTNTVTGILKWLSLDSIMKKMKQERLLFGH